MKKPKRWELAAGSSEGVASVLFSMVERQRVVSGFGSLPFLFFLKKKKLVFPFFSVGFLFFPLYIYNFNIKES